MWKMEGILPREAGTPAYIGGTLHASSRPAAKYLQKIHPNTRQSQGTHGKMRGTLTREAGTPA
jgi:hypothetical protein